MTESAPGPSTGCPASYEIIVEGTLNQDWQPWLDRLAIVGHRQLQDQAVTVLESAVTDQAALRGALGRLWDLNLVVVAVTRQSPSLGGER